MGFFEMLVLIAVLVLLHQVIGKIFVGQWPVKIYYNTACVYYTHTQVLAMFVAGVLVSIVLNAAIWSFLLSFTPLWVMFAVMGVFEVFAISILIKKSKN